MERDGALEIVFGGLDLSSCLWIRLESLFDLLEAQIQSAHWPTGTDPHSRAHLIKSMGPLELGSRLPT